ITEADAHRFLQNGAFASELAARFYFGLKRPDFAFLYLRKAHAKYVHWGAHGKAADLVRQYPGLLAYPSSNEADGTHRDLDISAVIRASQAISLETARIYEDMQQEVRERQRAELSLQQSYDSLEDRVSERTQALTAANSRLQREVSERMQAEEALERRLAMEDAIAVTSTRFINLRPEDFDSAITKALQTIAGFVGADCSYLAIYQSGGPPLMYMQERDMEKPGSRARAWL